MDFTNDYNWAVIIQNKIFPFYRYEDAINYMLKMKKNDSVEGDAGIYKIQRVHIYNLNP